MKKSLKEELVSLAHKILQMRDGASYAQMTSQAREVYEKLTILAYAEKLENAGKPTIGLEKVETSLEKENSEIVEEKVVKKPEKTPAEIAAANRALFDELHTQEKHRPDGTLFNKDEPVHEPVIEKIKDMVAEMPPEAAAIDELVEAIEPKSYQKNDMLEIGGEYAQTPIFEPVLKTDEEEKPKNLNDKLKSGLKIGLNDKIAFINHLFEGSDTDYNRVLSQLETFTTFKEAKDFISNMIKPDYNNWQDKEEYEERFMQIVSNKFE